MPSAVEKFKPFSHKLNLCLLRVGNKDSKPYLAKEDREDDDVVAGTTDANIPLLVWRARELGFHLESRNES